MKHVLDTAPFLTEKQQRALDELDYADTVSDRNNAAFEIATLQAAKQIVTGKKLIDGLDREILRREKNLKEITARLVISCKKLGINAETESTGEL